ncbi:unnamed protein product, partial [Arabidopsis halleri]
KLETTRRGHRRNRGFDEADEACLRIASLQGIRGLFIRKLSF